MHGLQDHRQTRSRSSEQRPGSDPAHHCIDDVYGRGEQQRRHDGYARESGDTVGQRERNFGKPLVRNEWLSRHCMREQVDARNLVRFEDVTPDTYVTPDVPVDPEQAHPEQPPCQGRNGED